jgi:hypothetical protein
MSSTRITSENSVIRQERFASSPDLRGDFLLANLVAKRCATITDPARRRMVLWIQEMSTRFGFETHPTCSQFDAWPLPFPKAYKGETGLDLLALEMVERSNLEPHYENRDAVKHWLIQLALDPSNAAFDYPQKFTKIERPEKLLNLVMTDALTAPYAKVADTRTKSALWDLLDYCRDSQSLCLAVGQYRIGKSRTAQGWTLCRGGGEARYVSLTSSPTQEAFFRQIGKSIGVATSLNMKAGEIAERITTTLAERRIMLILDEGQYLLPQTLRTKQAPARLTWLMSALCNARVPVCIVANQDWHRLMACLKRAVSWFGFEQWEGRLHRSVDLPISLTEADLCSVARQLAPEADKETITLLAACALRHSGHIATIEHVVELARHLAKAQGASLDFDFCQLAYAEIDKSYQPRLAPKPLRIVRDGSAAPMRPPFERKTRGITPAAHSAS